MKYAVFSAAVFVLVPFGVAIASNSRRIREVVFGLLVFSTAFTEWYDINFVERWWYAGSTRGIEVSFVDLLVLILLFSTLATLDQEGRRLYWPASLGMMLAFLGYACLSVLLLDPKLFGVFELVKLARGLLVFLTIAWYVRTERDAHILILALGAALIFNGGLAVWQRYTGLLYRAHGTFPHENILGAYCVLGAPVILAVGLLSHRPRVRLYCLVAWVSAAVATVLTISRMPSALFLVSSAAVLLTAYGLRIDRRRAALIFAMGILVCGIFYRGSDGLAERHLASRYGERTAEGGRSGHYRIGWNMAMDHPLGVGLNNWGWYFHEYSELAGHYDTVPYASTSDPGEGKATQGHTLYGLTLGELGWLGLLFFLLLIARWLFLCVTFFFTGAPDIWSRIGTACFVGFLAVFVANTTEIHFRNQQIFIVFNLLLGFVAAAQNVKSYQTIRHVHNVRHG